MVLWTQAKTLGCRVLWVGDQELMSTVEFYRVCF